MNYIDLFCGAGGLSYGFEQAGFKNLFSVEYNEKYAKTYARNFPHHNLLIRDIRDIRYEEIKDILGKEVVDVVVGGPPCQGFSIAGNIGRSFIDDERNHLFKEFVRIVEYVKPAMFLMENVGAMATHKKGKTIESIVHSFSLAGYNVVWDVLNSVDYGIAQERRRIMIIGCRKDLDLKFNFPKRELKKKTIKDVIDDLPPLDSGKASDIPNHIAMNHSVQMLEKMSYVRDGGNRYDIPEEVRPKSGDVRKYIRYDSSKPSVCVTGDMRKIFHYAQNRALTSRELARIQSFPDSFIFEGSSLDIQQQIGNAVPPALAFKIAKEISGIKRSEMQAKWKVVRKVEE